MSRPLLSARRFARALERVAERRLSGADEPQRSVRGVSLATVFEKRHQVSRRLVTDLRAGRLPPEPGRLYFIRDGQKRRRLFDFPVIELILHDAVAEWLNEQIGRALSARLYSYRTGTSYRRALQDLSRYVRDSSGLQNGSGALYVIRRDVRAYFDSIPVHEGAPLWTVLAGIVGDIQPTEWALIERTVRPEVCDGRTFVGRLSHGIPTGSPVANVVANLYLATMDREMAGIEGAFYARYGDDVIAAHPNPSSGAALGRRLEAHLDPAGLAFGATKGRNVYLTRAGRPAPTGIAAQPAADVEFLGHRVTAHGTVGLSRRKTRVLLLAVGARARGTARACASDDVERRVGAAVAALNQLFDPHHPAAHPYASLLRTTVTDRAYLTWLDHAIALCAVQAATCRRGVRGFRQFSPRLLRVRFGLRSIVVARNRCNGTQ